MMFKNYLMLIFASLILFTTVDDIYALSEPIKTFGMGKMNCAALSPDGKTIATAGAREFVYFWDSGTGRILDSMTVWSNVLSMAYSPDGRKIAIGSSVGHTYIYDVESGKEIKDIYQYDKWNNIESVAFSPDGKILACGWDGGELKLWDIESKQLLWISDDYRDNFSFSPDGSKIAAGSEKSLKIMDVNTGDSITTVSLFDGDIRSFVFTPDGERIICIGDSLRIIDISSGEIQETSFLDEKVNKFLTISPDGSKIAAGSWEGLVMVWDLASKELICEMDKHTGGVTYISFFPDGKNILTSSYDQLICKHNISSCNIDFTIDGHSSCFSSLSYSPDGTKLLCVSQSDKAIIWDIETEEIYMEFGSKELPIRSACYAPTENIIALGGYDSNIWLLIFDRDTIMYFKKEDHRVVGNLAFSPDNNLLAASFSDGTLKIFFHGLNYFDDWYSYKRSFNEVYSLDFSPTEEVIACGGRVGVYFLDYSNGNFINQYDIFGNSGGKVIYSPDGNKMAKIRSWGLSVYDLITKEIIISCKGNFPITDVDYSPDGSMLATTGKFSGYFSEAQKITIWNAYTGERHFDYYAVHYYGINSIIFSPDGKYFATGGNDGVIHIWESPDSPTSVAENFSSKDKFSIHPNPATSQITLSLGEEFISSPEINIIDYLGYKHEPEYQINNNEITIVTSTLSPGVYFLRVRSGDLVETRKFVVVR